MNITAKELSGLHIGKTVTLPFDDQTITGTLTTIEHNTDIISERSLCDSHNAHAIGHAWVYLPIWGNFEDAEHASVNLRPDTSITIQEGS